MSPGQLSAKVISERSEWIRRMLEGIRALPLESLATFRADPRTIPAAESFLRRGLEALLDLGRHVLAKGFGDAPTEYREVARQLGARGVLEPDEAELFGRMAGYRNRMVHFYDEVAEEELHEICTGRLGEIERVLGAIHRWIREHPERVDGSL
jgi:uncharacterized protein YutE (UPF0331/DUF86 family)